MRYADLHTHTYHSDGTRSPKEVIDVAMHHGLSIVAISDHDNIAAYFDIKRYAGDNGITLIPATELSCIHRGVDVHILAYAFDPFDERIEQHLKEFRDTRQRRGVLMVEKLKTLGVTISADRVEELAAGGAIGRPHVARALVEAGYVESVPEAFDKYIGTGKPAFVHKQRFPVQDAVSLIHACGGVTSVAHPSLYPDHRELVADVIKLGVDAIEVMHPDVSAEDREYYTQLAEAAGKFLTGGSDDHGKVKTSETLGTIHVPEEWIGAVLERL